MFFEDIPFQATVSEPQLPFHKDPCETMAKTFQNKKHPQMCGCDCTVCFQLLTGHRYSSATLRFLSLSISTIQTCAPPSTRAKEPAKPANITRVVCTAA